MAETNKRVRRQKTAEEIEQDWRLRRANWWARYVALDPTLEMVAAEICDFPDEAWGWITSNGPHPLKFWGMLLDRTTLPHQEWVDDVITEIVAIKGWQLPLNWLVKIIRRSPAYRRQAWSVLPKRRLSIDQLVEMVCHSDEPSIISAAWRSLQRRAMPEWRRLRVMVTIATWYNSPRRHEAVVQIAATASYASLSPWELRDLLKWCSYHRDLVSDPTIRRLMMALIGCPNLDHRATEGLYEPYAHPKHRRLLVDLNEADRAQVDAVVARLEGFAKLDRGRVWVT